MSALARRSLLGMFVAVNALWTLRSPPDPDWFLHVAYGREILARGQVDFPDPYLWTEPGRVWFDHHWGAQVIYALLDRLGGFELTMVFVSAVAALTALVALTGAFTRLPPRHALPLALLFTWALGIGTTPRPHVLSYLAFAALLGLWQRRSAWWWYAPLGLVWANVHGSVSLGIAVLGVLAIGEARAALDPRRWLSVAAMTAGASLNPHGFGLLLYSGGFLDPRFQLIQEWQPVNFRDPTYWGILGVLLLGGYLLMRSARRPSGAELVVLGGLVTATLLAVRHAPYLSVALVMITSGTRAPLPPADWGRGIGARIAAILPAATVSVLVAALVLGDRGETIRAGWARFPSDAAVAAIPKGARLFDRYDLGGALVYRGRRVFIDGRTDMYSAGLLADYTLIESGRPGFLEAIERWGVDHVIIRPGDRLFDELARTGGCFRTVFRDETAIVLKKVGPCERDPAIPNAP